MEIKLSAGDKIAIPTGCKATIEDDLIIIEEQKEEFKEEFKDGDILCSKDANKMVIFKRYDDDPVTFSSYYNNIYAGNSGWGTYYFRHATEEEKQAFFDELKAEGLHWNPVTMQMERIRRRAEIGERYLYICLNGEIIEGVEDGTSYDDNNFNSGNYYLLSERKEAETDAKAVKAIFGKRLKS